ncbi:unnamed protein product (macronuclear) [Paramecium tetraurelia]|uniref:Cyclin N-terminal domain-containing protein n=1 Tax=Paramecium tetraurelia TaxID=5888 RepID=A0BZG4_PARTE|nr:uncharacterized protein GSPATT00033784001 [Paramecium tetraurelia]CAK63931.1 unnamed protein product [Paramecium tetraurelia]|eukprot:XP_001431329.1 hypothetical protein (macronuclear) [Paramecium tetraurelia strain d4-2]
MVICNCFHQLLHIQKKVDIDGQKIKYDDQNTYQIISKQIEVESYILQMIGYDLHIIVTQVYLQEVKTKIDVSQEDSNQLIQFSQQYLSDYSSINHVYSINQRKQLKLKLNVLFSYSLCNIYGQQINKNNNRRFIEWGTMAFFI